MQQRRPTLGSTNIGGFGSSTFFSGTNGLYNQDSNEEEDFFDEEELIREAIFDRMDDLAPGRSLDISNIRIGQRQQVIGLRTIPTSTANRGNLKRIPGYPQLLVRPNEYEYYTSLLGARLNQSNGCTGAQSPTIRANGCSCGKF